MRIESFEIKNFKGIKHAKIDLDHGDSARVFTLVGLNESGKTTVLEALHSFSPDNDVELVVGNAKTPEQQRQASVPRSRIADFDGKVSVRANIRVDDKDRNAIKSAVSSEGIDFDTSSIPDRYYLERYHSFENGDFKGSFFTTNVPLKVRTGRQRLYRQPDTTEKSKVYDALRSILPVIAYFPTFVFDFPEKIYLSRFEGRKNSFYRELFQDILDYTGRGHKIAEHITNRVRKTDYKLPWSGFFNLFQQSNEREQIDQVIDLAAQSVTRVVFKRWNQIFSESPGNREISIVWAPEKGKPVKQPNGSEVEADLHDIYVQFRVKDGVDRFPIETRSLGFRWFFSFLLFTQFRTARSAGRPIIFLLDEPASNLHAAAQQKLIESFPEIAKAPHLLIYSTHSHYMIEPKWLEQAFIVQNEVVEATDSVFSGAVIDDSSVNVEVVPYRRFVDRRPNATSYFQPIIDRLSIVPSKFDPDRGGIIVEGKSDYYVLQYLNEFIGDGKLRLLPALGAGTMGALISLHRGWGLPVRVLLDSDKAGDREKKRYSEEFVLGEREITALRSLVTQLSEIEDVLSKEDREMIAKAAGASKATKKHILAFFQENLAGGRKVVFSSGTIGTAQALLARLREFVRLSDRPGPSAAG